MEYTQLESKGKKYCILTEQVVSDKQLDKINGYLAYLQEGECNLSGRRELIRNNQNEIILFRTSGSAIDYTKKFILKKFKDK